MPQVPYNPVPTVTPVSPGEEISISTPGAAFGENIAQAVEGLGRAVGTSGDEIFQRAVALQDLQNETAARQAASDYTVKQSLLHADFTSKEGENASPQALKEYLQRSQALRQTYRDALTNPAAQRMFDGDSFNFMNRNAFNAAGHAATEMKRAAEGSIDARADLITRTTVNPGSRSEMDSKKAELDRLSESKAALRGWTEDQRRDWVLGHTSRDIETSLTNLGMKDVNRAFDLAEKYKSQMKEEDYLRLQDRLMVMNRAQGSSFIANKVVKEGKPYDQALQEAKDMAPKYSHDDALFGDAVEHAVKAQYRNIDYVKTKENRENISKIDQAIQTTNPKSMDDLMADPGIAAAIEALPPEKRKGIPAAINSWNSARFRNAYDNNFTQLWGMANGDADDREKFLNLDIMKQNINQQQMRQLISKRSQMMKNPDLEDPRLHRAVGWLSDGKTGAWMNALNLSKKENPDDWYKFTGALGQAIDVWTQENGKAPSYKDVKETIGPNILRAQYHEPGMFGIYGGVFGYDRALFQRTVPQDFIDQAKARATSKNEPIPDDKEIFQAYMREQAIKLYGKSKESGGPPSGR